MTLMKGIGSSFSNKKKENNAVTQSSDTRSRGDVERDAGNWAEAAEFYRRHLSSKPDDFQIWVQHGNCLKEAGDFRGAEEAYRRAIALKSDDSDVHLQLGHLMKRKGQLAAAVECYNRALELDPRQHNALMELKALGVDVSFHKPARPERQRAAGPVTYYDIFDLIQFLRVHLRVTGIQRVVINIVAHLLNEEESSRTIAFCAVTTRPDGQARFDPKELPVFDPAALRELISVLNAPWLTREILDETLDAVLSTQVAGEIRAADVYVIVGAFWIIVDFGPVLQRIKETGALICTYIYDLIPITHPQYVLETTGGDYNRIFSDILFFSDFFLAISDYSAQQLRKLLQAELNIEKPVFTVALAHEQPSAPNRDSRGKRPISGELRALADRPFALVVSTLEGRKNHILLYRVWASMIRKYGSEKVPQLVLVGKWGWRIDEFRTLCESSDFLNGKISVLSDLRDDELSYLYEHCTFTILPSFVEGWGLAIGESLAAGKPCLASNAASIPEVGGDLVAYFDPYDVFGATELIEKAIFNKAFLPGMAARIKAEFRPRSWEDVALLFDGFVQQTAEKLRNARSADPSNGQVRIPIDPGKLYEISGKALLNRRDGTSWSNGLIRLIRYSGWSVFEEWGSWSIERRAQLRLAVGLEHARKEAVVYLELRLPPGAGDKFVRVSDRSGNSTTLMSLAGPPKWVKCKVAVDDHGFLDIFVERNTPDPKAGEDVRGLRVGFSGFGYYLHDDITSRLNLIEDFMLTSR